MLRAEFNEKNAAEDLKKFIGSVKDMAGVMISAKEKEEDMKISKAGVVELLSPEIIGAKIALGAGKMLLSSINVSVDNFVCEIDLKVPAEFQAMIKAEHIPMIAGAAGIISAIAVPNFNRSRDRARLKSCTANMKTITGGCELYYMEKGESDSLSVELLVKEGFIKHIPLCPFMKNGCEYKIINGKNGFDVQCPHHGRLSEL